MGLLFRSPSKRRGSLSILALGVLLQSVSPYTLAILRRALGRLRFGRWRSTALVQPCRGSCHLLFRLRSGSLLLLHQAIASLGWLSCGAPCAPSKGGINWRFFAALSVGFTAGGTSRTSAPLLALSTGAMLSLPSSGR